MKLQKKDNKYVTYDKFSVSSISYNENREITGLSIINQNGKMVYSLMNKAAKPQESPVRQQSKADKTEQYAETINKELQRTGVALDAVLQRYGVASIQEMDDATYRRAMNSLKRTKTKAA